MVLLADNLSMFDPASPGAYSIRSLTILVLAITGFIFLLVEGILVYAVYRFRGGMGETEPPQVYGSKPIEIAWTAAPALIVFVLTMVTVRTIWETTPTPPAPQPGDHALFVTAIGHQWWWEYRYDHYDGRKHGFITANELHIPVGNEAEGVIRPVYLTLLSADVCHSYWVPRLGGKTDMIPGRTNYMWLQTDRPDLYLGQCAEFCGSQHANMLIRVVAEPAEDFQRWLANEEKDQAPKDKESEVVTRGRMAFLQQSCVNCHRIAGTAAAGTYAPDLTHLMSRRTLAAGMIPNTPDNLRQWIADPQKIKPSCLMPAFGLSDRDRDLIVDYLATLR